MLCRAWLHRCQLGWEPVSRRAGDCSICPGAPGCLRRASLLWLFSARASTATGLWRTCVGEILCPAVPPMWPTHASMQSAAAHSSVLGCAKCDQGWFPDTSCCSCDAGKCLCSTTSDCGPGQCCQDGSCVWKHGWLWPGDKPGSMRPVFAVPKGRCAVMRALAGAAQPKPLAVTSATR